MKTSVPGTSPKPSQTQIGAKTASISTTKLRIGAGR